MENSARFNLKNGEIGDVFSFEGFSWTITKDLPDEFDEYPEETERCFRMGKNVCIYPIEDDEPRHNFEIRVGCFFSLKGATPEDCAAQLGYIKQYLNNPE